MHADYLACSNATYINNEVVFSPFVCSYTPKCHQHKCTCNKLFQKYEPDFFNIDKVVRIASLLSCM